MSTDAKQIEKNNGQGIDRRTKGDRMKMNELRGWWLGEMYKNATRYSTQL